MEKKIVLTVLLSVCMAAVAMGQVTIGSHAVPEKANLLQIESTGGLGLSRVELESFTTLEPFIPLAEHTDALKKRHAGLTVYNLAKTNGFKQGIYVWDGAKWAKAREGGVNEWFYMPPFNLPLEEEGQTYPFDLYAEYVRQFDPKMGTMYAKDKLDYVVTYYDTDIITISGIDNDGVMTYTVKDNDPGSNSFMTVVLVIKE